ncbi:MAG: hypothetical protein ACREOO_22030 [bacterium]
MNLDLKFSVSAVYPVLFLLCAFLFTWFIYRRTTPPVTHALRRFLAALRGLALAAALLLLLEPILGLAFQRAQKPVVAILIDRSASMGLADSGSTRADRARAALALPWLERLGKHAEVSFFAFSDSLQTVSPGSLQDISFNGDGSDLSEALQAAKEKLAGKSYRAVVMLSDGAHNLGANPARTAENYGLPILTVRLGSDLQARDAMISEVVTNEIAYAETQLPVEISIAAAGFAGQKTRLRVFAGEQEIATQEVELPADNTQTTAKITLTPTQLGLNRYTVKLDTLAGEQTLENNRRVFYVRVLKSKLNLWVFAGGPSADYAFLKRALAGDPNYHVRGFVQRPGGGFYNAAGQALPAFGNSDSWKQVDGVITIDFPLRDTERALVEMIKTQLTEHGKPLLYVHGPNVDPAMLWQWRSALPLANVPALMNERSMSLHLEAGGLAHPVTRPLVEANTTGDDLPPLFTNVHALQAMAGSEVLMSAYRGGGKQSAGEPLWLAQKNAARKTLAIFSYGLWRWHLMLQTVEGKTGLYDQIVRGLVRWMVTKEDAKLVRISSNKEIYRGGEQVELLAQVYREDYVPLEGAQVQVQLSGPQWQQDLILQDAGSGLYRARLQVLSGGEYQFRGAAELSGKNLGEDSGKFSVEPFSSEFLQTRVNEPLLRQLAEASGGAYLPPDSLEQAVARLPLDPVIKYESRDYAFWGKWPVLFVLLLTLAVEWFLRKREGML